MKPKNKTYLKEYDLVLHWSVTNTCNFCCPQCIANAVKLKDKYAPEIINIPILRKFLKKLNKTAKIVFTGGEPLLVENIIEGFIEITKKHYIALNTNLVSEKVAEFAKKIDCERVDYITASAHLFELERQNLLDKFLSNFHLLKEKGHNIYVAEIAYPSLSEKVDYYQKIFADHNIEIQFQTFRGQWQNKKYPESYTEEEFRIFNFNKIRANRPDIFKRKDELCNAGYNVAVINKDGQIHPCFSIFDPIGSITEGINFRNTLIKCPMDFCSCAIQDIDPVIFEKALIQTNNNKALSIVQ